MERDDLRHYVSGINNRHHSRNLNSSQSRRESRNFVPFTDQGNRQYFQNLQNDNFHYQPGSHVSNNYVSSLGNHHQSSRSNFNVTQRTRRNRTGYINHQNDIHPRANVTSNRSYRTDPRADVTSNRSYRTDMNSHGEDRHRSLINRGWRLAPVYDHQNHHHNNRHNRYHPMTDVRSNRAYSTDLNSHDQDRGLSNNRGWRPVHVYDYSSDAVHSHDRHLQRHRSQPEFTQASSERNNQRHQRSNNPQQSARTNSWDSMVTNGSSEQFISVEVYTVLQLIQFVQPEEETIIFDDAYQLLDESEDEELDADFELALNYEELLALQERLGRVNSGLSEQTVSRHLKTMTGITSTYYKNLKELDKQEICVVCLGEYEEKDIVGTLQCGHEYHANCIKKWLLENNNCPVCRRTALAVD